MKATKRVANLKKAFSEYDISWPGSPDDVCYCGDYRKDHAGGTGGCVFTPDPDHDRADSDGHGGTGPCYKFRLAQ